MFDALGMVYADPWFFLCNLSLSVTYVIFTIFLQITELQKDQVNIATALIEKVLDNPDKEIAKLLKAAQEDYESEYISCTRIQDTYECYWRIPEYIFGVHFD